MFRVFVYNNIYCVGVGMNTLMSISDGFGFYNFCGKMEKMRPIWEKMDGKVFISRQSRHFFFIVDMIKVLFPNCNLAWRVNNYYFQRTVFPLL